MKKILLSLLFASVSFAGNEIITSFSDSKDLLKEKIYPGHQVSIYCGCTYKRVEQKRNYEEERAKAEESWKVYHWDSLEGFTFPTYEEWKIKVSKSKRYKLVPNHKSCGYVPKGSGARAAAIEWEHVVPAYAFGHNLTEWSTGSEKCFTPAKDVRKCERRDDGTIECYMKHYPAKTYKGRRCADKVNEDFQKMQADMHNLYPAIGEVNGYRNNFPMAEIEGEAREFGKCDAEIKNKEFEPAPYARGEIARTYFYMEQSYSKFFKIPEGMKKMLTEWAKLDKVDEWECKRNEKISKLQGNVNPFVKQQCDKMKEAKKTEQEKLQRFKGIYKD